MYIKKYEIDTPLFTDLIKILFLLDVVFTDFRFYFMSELMELAF